MGINLMFFEGRIIFLYTLKKLREKFLSNWFVGYLMLKQTMNFCDSSPHLNPYYISNTVFPLCSCVLLVFCVSVWIAPVMVFCPPKNEHFCETTILTFSYFSQILIERTGTIQYQNMTHFISPDACGWCDHTCHKIYFIFI